MTIVKADDRHYYLAGLIAIIAMMLVLVGVMMYKVLHRPLPAFAAIKAGGETMSLTPFTEPNILSDALLRWASRAASTAYTFDFVNYEEQIAKAKPYFTEAGWSDFRSAISRVLSTVVANQLFVTGIVSGAPVISNQGPLPDKGYVWRIQIPFLVTYQSANTSTKNVYVVALSIVQVPTSINPQGIGIDQFQMVRP